MCNYIFLFWKSVTIGLQKLDEYNSWKSKYKEIREENIIETAREFYNTIFVYYCNNINIWENDYIQIVLERYSLFRQCQTGAFMTLEHAVSYPLYLVFTVWDITKKWTWKWIEKVVTPIVKEIFDWKTTIEQDDDRYFFKAEGLEYSK